MAFTQLTILPSTASAVVVPDESYPGDSAPSVSRPGARIDSLDGLRTVAILMVVLYHLHVPHFTGGFIGVNIFYVLSGYLITSILLRERHKTGRIQLGRFWVRRALRLYPGLLAVVVAAASLWFLLGDYKGANVDAATAAFLSLTYTANIGRWLGHRSLGVLSQTWSLAMEEQFYLVWPPLLAMLAKIRVRRSSVMGTLAAIVAGSTFLGWLLFQPRGGGATPDVYFSPVLNISPLLCGVILALALSEEGARGALSGWMGEAATWVGAVAIVAIAVLMPSDWGKSSVTFGVELPLVAFASTLLVAGLVCRQSLLSLALTFRPLAWFGKNVSYSLYLWHVIVIALVAPLLPGVAGMTAGLVASVLVSIAGHFAIERPIGRLARRIAPASRRRPPGQSRPHAGAELVFDTPAK